MRAQRPRNRDKEAFANSQLEASTAFSKLKYRKKYWKMVPAMQHHSDIICTQTDTPNVEVIDLGPKKNAEGLHGDDKQECGQGASLEHSRPDLAHELRVAFI
eukprot:9901675-Karenia_brevis.AAC.1